MRSITKRELVSPGEAYRSAKRRQSHLEARFKTGLQKQEQAIAAGRGGAQREIDAAWYRHRLDELAHPNLALRKLGWQPGPPRTISD